MDKVAVLIPTHNRATLLPDCLESIYRQTYENIEVFIYNDGSTDNTRKIIKPPPHQHITYFGDVVNRGVSFARNELLRRVKASGIEYACWQDSDDMSNIYRIEMQLKVLKGESSACITSCHTRLTNQNKQECFQYPQLANKDRGRSFGSTMFRLQSSVPFVKGVDFGGEDIDWRRDMIAAGHEFINLPCRLYYVRVTNTDRIGNKKKRYPNRRKKSNANRSKNRNLPDV